MPNNYTLFNLIRTGISPLLATIGTTAYYAHLLNSPLSAGINALLHIKRLGIDIWDLNAIPNIKSKILNGSKKIAIGIGTLSLINYNKFTEVVASNFAPTTTAIPITNATTPLTTTTPLSTTPLPITTTIPITTSTALTTFTPPCKPDPFTEVNCTTPAFLRMEETNNANSSLLDWDTYSTLTLYAGANIISGVFEILPINKVIRKIGNVCSSVGLMAAGLSIGIEHNFDNPYVLPTVFAGAAELAHSLIPIEKDFEEYTQLQETSFNENTARAINALEVPYDFSDSSLSMLY